MLAQADVVRLRELREAGAADNFPIVRPSQWGNRLPPRRDWMVERCFVRGSVALVSGDGGIGKSLLMQQLLTSAVMGWPFLGLSCQPGRALFFGCEDDGDELERRQYDINRQLGVSNDDIDEAGLILAPRVGFDNALARLCRDKQSRLYWQMEPTRLFERMLERCLEEGVSYVVIDTATQVFAGNQNDETQVMQFCNMLRKMAVMIQGIVILVKHPSAAGRALGTGESGSVQWHNSVRSRLYMHKDKTAGLVLASRKSNYGPADMELPIRWERGAYVLNEPEPPAPGRYGYSD